MCLKSQCRKPLEIEQGLTKVLNNTWLLCYLKTLYIQIFKMAAMLQQQYVVQETEPRDWAICGGICRYKTFCMRIFERRTFLRFIYCSIHVKMHVLLTYFAVKRRV